VALIVVLGAPTLLLAYLPMTDLPQHLAIARILQKHGDPAFGFAAWYEIDLARTLYVLPYALALALAKLLPLALAMRAVVFLSVIAYPLGLLALLHATRRPLQATLLAFPLAYNTAFYWGFINFNLAIGLALGALALLVRPQPTWRSDAVLLLLLVAAALTHAYGPALFCAGAVGWALFVDRRVLRLRVVVPALVAVAAWAALGGRARGYGQLEWPSLGERVADFPAAILGGFADPSERVILLLAGALVAWSVARRRPWAAWRALDPVERWAYPLLALNLILYFVVPKATATAKFIHFRHAILFAALAPAVIVVDRRSSAALVGLALVAVLNVDVHLVAFDREARPFDRIVERLPPAPKVVSLAFEREGNVMRSHPYMHFAGYVQARRGGLVTMTFPAVFWNLPVRMRSGAVPASPPDFEWHPELFDEAAFGHFYDWALVRQPGVEFVPSPRFPFELVASEPPWQLYRRVQR
jgi:hypothetical protein